MRCEDFIVSEQQSNRMYGAVLPRGGHCGAQRQTRRVGGASLPVKAGLPCAPVQLLNPLLWWRGGRSFPARQGQPRLLDLLLPGGWGAWAPAPIHALTVPTPLLLQERPPLSSPSCCCSSSSPWWLLSGTSGGLKGESGLLGARKKHYLARTETVLAGLESLSCAGQTSRTTGGGPVRCTLCCWH